MTGLLADIRYALRAIRKHPAAAAAVAATLAVGIGPTTALFSVVDGVLLRPLPYPDADRIVAISQFGRDAPDERREVSPAHFLALRDRGGALEAVGAAEPGSLTLQGPSGPETIPTWSVSDGFFRVLRTPAHLGRTFLPDEHAQGRGRVVVLSDGLWRDRFGGDPAVLGRTLSLDGVPHTVVGVMPPGFRYPVGEGRLWAPRAFTEEDRGETDPYLEVVGRLRPGTTLEQAQAEVGGVAAALDAQGDEGVRFALVPLGEALVGGARRALLVLLGAAGLVLAVACANVANLMVIRGLARERDLAIRVALGADRAGIARLVAAESALLALLGGASGVVLAFLALRALPVLGPPDIPRLDEVRMDLRVLAFALALSMGTALLFAMMPALRATRVDPVQGMREGGRTAGSSPWRRRVRSALVAGEVALALILVVGLGLLARSFTGLLQVERGFRPEGVLAVTVFAWDWYPEKGQRAAFAAGALQRIRDLPGVAAAGATSSLPMAEAIAGDRIPFSVEGRAEAPAGKEPVAHRAIVTPGYFEAMGIAVRRGRLFGAGDGAGPGRVVVINETLARRHFGDLDPVGRHIRLIGSRSTETATVLGVVADVRQDGLLSDPPPSVYIPHAQSPTGSLVFTVRTAGDPEALLAPVRQAVWAVNPAIPLYSTTTMEALVADQVRDRRFYLLLLGLFAGTALLLVVIGVYGVLGQAVAEERRSIAVRLVLGARATDVTLLVLRAGLLITLCGVLAGLMAAAALAGTVRGMLYGVSPIDPVSFGAAAVLVLAIALAACLLPALHAASVNPASALGQD